MPGKAVYLASSLFRAFFQTLYSSKQGSRPAHAFHIFLDFSAVMDYNIDITKDVITHSVCIMSFFRISLCTADSFHINDG